MEAAFAPSRAHLQVRMTDLTRLFRAGAFPGTFLTAVLAFPMAVIAQQQPSPAMPRPRYQSPAVAAPVRPGLQTPSEPQPQYQMPKTVSITPNAEVVEDVIVRVNDNIISRSDVERAQAQLDQELVQNPNAGDPVERQKNLLRDLIDQQLLLSKGKDLNINPDAEVVRRLDDIRKQNNLPSMEALEQAVRSQGGIAFEDFRASIRNNIITGQVVRDEVGRTLKMSHADEQKYYDAHKADFAQPEQVRLSEILVPLAANADDTQVAAAQKSAQEIYDKLKGGADFAATAKAQSGGPTAAQGGDLGQFKHGALAAVLETKTFALPVGGFTEPTRTRQGWVILKATEHQQAGTPPLETVEGEVQNAIYQDQIQPALRAYLTRLREQAYIDIRPGFVDSAASAKETKPVFAAYVPPAPKKAKPEKARMDAGRMAQTKTAATATVAPAVVVLDKHGKPKKVKREKVRYGQAPRTALPDAPGDTPTTTAAAASAEVAPGQVISPLGEATNTTIAANAAPDATLDALSKPAAPHNKTRFASREVEVKAKKTAKVQAKVEEKAKATPDGPTTEEKQAKTVQASALGLNGSDATKKKKTRTKHKKGDPKDPKNRLQEQTVTPKAPLQDNGLPDRLHQVNGPAKPVAPAADGSALPPATPAPATTPAAVPTPATGAPPDITPPTPQ